MRTEQMSAREAGAYDRRSNNGRTYPRWCSAAEDRQAYDAGYDDAAGNPLSPNAANEIAKEWREPTDDARSNMAATPGLVEGAGATTDDD
jgi:hypothetical protein